MAALLSSHRPRRVVNLAAQAGVRYSLENPLSYIDDIIKGVVRVPDKPAEANPI